MTPTSPAVETFQLVKQFGDFVAVDHINLQVNRGGFFGFLGPNGAGKSTTIKMLTGLLAPTSGKLRVLDFDVSEQPMEVKRRIGVVPEDLNLFERLTGAEMLAFTGRMYGLRKDDIAQRAKPSVVHVRRPHRDIAKRRRFKTASARSRVNRHNVKPGVVRPVGKLHDRAMTVCAALSREELVPTQLCR